MNDWERLKVFFNSALSKIRHQCASVTSLHYTSGYFCSSGLWGMYATSKSQPVDLFACCCSVSWPLSQSAYKKWLLLLSCLSYGNCQFVARLQWEQLFSSCWLPNRRTTDNSQFVLMPNLHRQVPCAVLFWNMHQLVASGSCWGIWNATFVRYVLWHLLNDWAQLLQWCGFHWTLFKRSHLFFPPKQNRQKVEGEKEMEPR